MARPDEGQGVGCFREGVGAVDHGRDLPRKQQVGQDEEVPVLLDRGEGPQVLTGERGQQARLDDPTERTESAAASSTVGDQGAAGRQRSPRSGQRLGLHVVEDHVVALPGAGEVGCGVVDDVVGTE